MTTKWRTLALILSINELVTTQYAKAAVVRCGLYLLDTNHQGQQDDEYYCLVQEPRLERAWFEVYFRLNKGGVLSEGFVVP